MNNSAITTAADQLSTTLRGCTASEFTDAERDALGRCLLTLMSAIAPNLIIDKSPLTKDDIDAGQRVSKLLENPEAGEIT